MAVAFRRVEPLGRLLSWMATSNLSHMNCSCFGESVIGVRADGGRIHWILRPVRGSMSRAAFGRRLNRSAFCDNTSVYRVFRWSEMTATFRWDEHLRHSEADRLQSIESSEKLEKLILWAE